MTDGTLNIDERELAKFSHLAPRWWDKDGECKPLHDINPLRLRFIAEHAPLAGRRVLDVGCGGGILSEGLATQHAEVTAIDASEATIGVARLHLFESGLKVDYHCTTVELFAQKHAGQFDVVTCMEMLEHVPDPASVIASCARLLKPEGRLFLSSINRTAKAFALAIVGAEYVLNMLPKGTHDYAKFLRPSELDRMLRDNGLTMTALRGMSYNPLLKRYSLRDDVDVNYLLCASR